MPDDIKAMQEAVQARAQKREAVPPAAPPAPLSEELVMRCERENFLGDGKIYQHLHRGKVLYVHKHEKWLA